MDMFEKTMRLSKLLKNISEGLDIPESKFLEAEKRYQAVGAWLNAEGSALAQYKPEIYPQGSIRLGTVVKPISNKDEYDIDLVCFLANLKKEATSQKELKNIVGNRIKENETYKRLLDKEGRRCWTLNYANEFHMDILPAVEDKDLRMQGGLYKDAILISDKEKIEQGDLEWPKSNPGGYATWFFSRQEAIFMSRKKQLAELLKASVDEIPDYKVRTPLQRAVQLLKRHRDIYFTNKKDESKKPISIIITTIAANLYRGQDNIYNAIYDILQETRKEMTIKNGKFNIPNPSNPEENFADKWNEDPSLPKAFFEWMNNAKVIFCEEIIKRESELEIGKVLKDNLGSIDARHDKTDESISPVYIKVDKHTERRPWGLNE